MSEDSPYVDFQGLTFVPAVKPDNLYTVCAKNSLGMYHLSWKGQPHPSPEYTQEEIQTNLDEGIWLVLGPPCAQCEKTEFLEYNDDLDYLCPNCRP